MNRGQMRLEVRRQLGEPVADLWSDEELNDWLNEGAMLMANESEALQAFWQKTATNGQGEYLLPASVAKVLGVKYYNGTLTTLRPTDPALHGMEGDQPSGTPTLYYIRQYVSQTAYQGTDGDIDLANVSENPNAGRSIIGFWAIPGSSTDTFTVYFIPRHFLMVADGDVSPIPMEYHRGIIAYATALAKEKEEAYAEANEIFYPKFKEFKDNLKREMIARGQVQAFQKAKVVDECNRSGSSWIQLPDSPAGTV